jgi:hypothetical protein
MRQLPALDCREALRQQRPRPHVLKPRHHAFQPRPEHLARTGLRASPVKALPRAPDTYRMFASGACIASLVLIALIMLGSQGFMGTDGDNHVSPAERAEQEAAVEAARCAAYATEAEKARRYGLRVEAPPGC